MGKVNVIIVDTTGNKEQKVGMPDDIICGRIMVQLVKKIKLPSVGPDGNPISYKFVHKVTGRQLLETQTLAQAGIKDGDVLRLQPEITAGALCPKCGFNEEDGNAFCSKCGSSLGQPAPQPVQPAPQPVPVAQPVPMGQPQPNMYPPVQNYRPAPKMPIELSKITWILGAAGVILQLLMGLIFDVLMLPYGYGTFIYAVGNFITVVGEAMFGASVVLFMFQKLGKKE